MSTLTTVDQDIFQNASSAVRFITYEEHMLSSDYLNTFLGSSSTPVLGLSASYGSKNELSYLAIATGTLVLLVDRKSVV